jgi:hypothetical protein
MELLVLGGALITLDTFVLARFGYSWVRGARRRAFLERRLGMVEPADARPAPRTAVSTITSSPTFV